jgi:hypothetical protein
MKAVALLFLAAITAMADPIFTTTLFAASPLGNVTAGATSTIAMFEMVDQNDPVRLESLRFLITETGSLDPWTAATNVASDIGGVQLFDDTGAQVGSTETPASCSGAIFATNSFDCSFASLAFVFPANSVRVFSIRLNILPGTDVATLRAALIPSLATNAIQTDDGENRLRIPIVGVNGNLLQVSAADAAIPEPPSLMFCVTGLGFLILKLRRREF